MLEREREIRLVGKLFKLTNAGELRWRRIDDPGNPGDDRVVSETYNADVGELSFSIYQTRSRSSAVDPDNIIIGRVWAQFVGGSGRRWSTVTVLEVESKRDGGRESIFDVNDMPLMRMLYHAAKKSVTSIDADIEAFIGQEERHAERHHG